MLIHSISFQDKETQWQLEVTTFDHLTLIVGASGVGKTKILQKIELLKRIALGRENVSGQWAWTLVFSLDDGNSAERYRWWGKTAWRSDEVSSLLVTDHSEERAMVFAEEYLQKESQNSSIRVFTRQKNHLTFGNTHMPQLHGGKSALSLFADEPQIAAIRHAFQCVVRIGEDSWMQEWIQLPQDLQRLNVKQIRESHVPLFHKLAALYQVDRQHFQLLVDAFTSFFPTVEGIRFQTRQRNRIMEYELQIKESGSRWIDWHDVSAGMRKTLFHLAAFELLPDSSVVLIDEFENGLGVNCLDQSFHRLDGRDDIQCILTSHHPYIINQIPMQSWKIVSRDEGQIRTRDAGYYQLGRSKHQAFKQLLNLTVFTEGREDD